MKTELLWLTWTTILTALIWLPYVGDRMMVRGVLDTVGYPQEPKSQSPWANRMKAAHLNAIENLVVFATLVFVANAAGISNAATTFAAAFYFWARVVHLIAHTLGLPLVRTLGFAGGFVAQVIFAWQIVVH